jgi:hypothetical protein
MTMTASPLHRVVPGQRLLEDQPATPRPTDPTNTRGMQATRDGGAVSAVTGNQLVAIGLRATRARDGADTASALAEIRGGVGRISASEDLKRGVAS